MIVATVIPPSDTESHSCSICDISYSSEHYKILIENKKIAYFRLEEDGVPQEPKENIPQDCVCHECLYNILVKEAAGKTLKVKMVYFGQEGYGIVDPNDESGFF